MRDDYSFNFKFIDLVKKKPCLYDSTRSDYKSNNRHSQDTAWLEIAKEVEESVTDCKEKWKNLRACYTRHLKNMNRATPTGKHSKPYYLAEKLSFLYNFTKTKNQREDNNEDCKIEPEQVSQSSHKLYDNSEDSSDLETPIIFHNAIKNTASGIKESLSDVKIPKKTVQPMSETTAQEKHPESLRTMCPDLAFLYSLLPDIKEMNAAQKRKFKIGILSLTNDILQENDSTTGVFMEDIPEDHVPPRNKTIRTY